MIREKISLRWWILSAVCGAALLGAGTPAQAAVAETATFPLTNTFGVTSGVIDPVGGFMYFGSTLEVIPSVISSGSLNIFQLSTFPSAPTNFSLFEPVTAMTFDPQGQAVYFGSQFGSLYRRPTSGVLTISSSPVLTSGIGSLTDDPAGGFLYAGTLTSPAFIVKLTTGAFPVAVSTMTLSWSTATVAAIDTALGFAYFGSSATVPGTLTQINLASFSQVNTLTLPAGTGGIASLAIDTTTGFGYIGTTDSPGKIIKFQLSNLNIISTLVLRTGENNPAAGVIDVGNHIAYFGTDTSPGQIVTVQLSGVFQEGPTTLTLAGGENGLDVGVIDTANQLAYFGTSGTPALVIEVDLLGGAPVIIQQPRNQSVTIGNTATFTVAATGHNLTYQWQQAGVDISGATAASYTFGPTVITDNGSSFDCVVSNSSGSVTSRNAVLSVEPVVRVYPDPWRADRHSGLPITFDGLPTNSTVKIFTLSAHWVKSLTTSTGAVSWDRTNDQGQLVASGYYLYVVKSGDDNQTVSGKFAIIK